MRQLNQGRDFLNSRDFGLHFSDHINEMVLEANVAQRQAIPSGARWVKTPSTANFRIIFGDENVNAANAEASVEDGTASDMNTDLVYIPIGATHVSCISDQACRVVLAYYAAND